MSDFLHSIAQVLDDARRRAALPLASPEYARGWALRSAGLPLPPRAHPELVVGYEARGLPDQERDENGRWVSGGGSGDVTMVTDSEARTAAEAFHEEHAGKGWTLGHEEVHKALTETVEGTAQRAVITDKEGGIAAACLWHKDKGTLYIDHVGSTGSMKRAGTAALREALDDAGSRNVELNAYPSAYSYYESLGFENRGNGDFFLDGADVPDVLFNIDTKLEK